MIRLLLFLSLTLALQAAMPKTYASIGDPVYRAVGPVETLTSFKTFQSERALFKGYIEEAARAAEEGRWLDTHRRLPGTKKRADAYLKTLRHLQQVKAQITEIVKNKMMHAIRKHQTRTYSAIKKSGYPALIGDAELRRASVRFEKRLRAEHRRERERQARAKEDFLRSYDNLKGEWSGRSASGKTVVYRFLDKRRIEIIKRNDTRTQTLEGTWRVNNDVLTVTLQSITNQRRGDIPHQRDADIKLQKQIRAVDTKKLTLFDTRRKTLLNLLR
jgi:hypothetical protein